MIGMFSTYLSLLLLKEQIITADDEEIYKYGFEITIANMVLDSKKFYKKE